MAPAKQSVAPRLPTGATSADANTTGETKVFDVVIAVDFRGKTGDNATFEAEPIVGEIGDVGVQTDHAGVDDVRLETKEFCADVELPAIVVAVAEENLRLRLRKSRTGGKGRRLRDGIR